jgi:hypothetical protein
MVEEKETGENIVLECELHEYGEVIEVIEVWSGRLLP